MLFLLIRIEQDIQRTQLFHDLSLNNDHDTRDNTLIYAGI